MDKGEWFGVICVGIIILFVPVAIGLGVWCSVKYWDTPWVDVPFICHK